MAMITSTATFSHLILLSRNSFNHDTRRQIKSSGLNEPLARFCHVGVAYNEGEQLFISIHDYSSASTRNSFLTLFLICQNGTNRE